jgi:hypothetical protein
MVAPAVPSVSVMKMWKKTATNRGVVGRMHRQTTPIFPTSGLSHETLSGELSVHRLVFGGRGSESQKVAMAGLISLSSRSVEGAKIGEG